MTLPILNIDIFLFRSGRVIQEEVYRKNYTSEADFKRGVDSYIEFYNTQWPHRTLKNLTPCQVEDIFMEGNT